MAEQHEWLITDILVHVIPLRPGTMTWLFDNHKKRKPRSSSRAAYKVSESSKARSTGRKKQTKRSQR